MTPLPRVKHATGFHFALVRRRASSHCSINSLLDSGLSACNLLESAQRFTVRPATLEPLQHTITHHYSGTLRLQRVSEDAIPKAEITTTGTRNSASLQRFGVVLRVWIFPLWPCISIH